MKHDKSLLQQRFARRLESYASLATVQRGIADRLAQTLFEGKWMSAPPLRGVEIGTGTGFLTRHLVAHLPDTEWTLNDLVAKSRDYLPQVTSHGLAVRFEAGDGEAFPFIDSHYGLIASASTLQWFDDLSAFIVRAARGLTPGGILAISTFGPDNFREITATTGYGLEYPTSVSLLEGCQAAKLTVRATQEWHERQLYPSPLEVLRHLRLTGVNAVAAERWTHRRLRQFETEYTERFSSASATNPTETNVSLTFHPIILIAQKS